MYSMKQLVGLESFIDPIIEQLKQRIDNAINIANLDGIGNVAHISLDECVYFLLADAVGEIAVSKLVEAVHPLSVPQQYGSLKVYSVRREFWPPPR